MNGSITSMATARKVIILNEKNEETQLTLAQAAKFFGMEKFIDTWTGDPNNPPWAIKKISRAVGYGFIARKAFAVDEIVIEYAGEDITDKNPVPDEYVVTNLYAPRDPKNPLYFITPKSHGNEGRFVLHADTESTSPSAAKPNVRFKSAVDAAGKRVVNLIAITHIEPGDMFFVDYGKGWWECREKILPSGPAYFTRKGKLISWQNVFGRYANALLYLMLFGAALAIAWVLYTIFLSGKNL